MRGYENMFALKPNDDGWDVLRIPMRGYEGCVR